MESGHTVLRFFLTLPLVLLFLSDSIICFGSPPGQGNNRAKACLPCRVRGGIQY